MPNTRDMDICLLPKPRLDELIRVLAEDGYEVIGPRIDQGAIIYAPLDSTKDLPIGWTDRQAPGFYRLERRNDSTYFGFAVGPHSWKRYLFPPSLRLWQAQRVETGFVVRDEQPVPPRRAFLGVRSCELQAIAVQDRVFINRAGTFTDPHYAKVRERLFLIAVECEHPGGTCFCASMGAGPEVQPERIPLLASKHDDAASQTGSGDPGRVPGRVPLTMATPPAGSVAPAPPVCDLVLTELENDFVIRATSAGGHRVLERLQLAAASPAQLDEARRRVAAAARAMGRSVDVTDVRGLLRRNQENPRWDEVAGRCLACTNCTLVCPTCFCSCTEDVTDLSLETAERVRRWDSCFNPEFARVHGGNFRPSIRGRYRQWLTHKFASWFDQFDTSGCVGCGRCITWCPVGIDVTEEITAIRATDGHKPEKP
jgi:formate hydrogenlyase subunit 6/NADH:ubiquinone oxidoreductase subunit I